MFESERVDHIFPYFESENSNSNVSSILLGNIIV